MSNSSVSETLDRVEKLEYCTFYVEDLLIGVDIRQVEEINRQIDVTPIPHAHQHVRGVINLRGEVVTVVDLRTILGLPSSDVTYQTRNVIVNSCGEQIGLLVDRVGDVVAIRTDFIDPLPANFDEGAVRLFLGVYKMKNRLLALLDIETALNSGLAHT